MGKSTKKFKSHQQTPTKSPKTKEFHEKINSCKTYGLDLKAIMCMTMVSDNSAVNFTNISLKELCQQLECHLTRAEFALQACIDIKKYVIKYVPEKLVSSVPCLLKVLPLLLSSPTAQLRCTACDTLVLLFTKVGWSTVSSHSSSNSTLLVEPLIYALASPMAGVQQDALKLLKRLMLVTAPRSCGPASQLLPLYAPLLVKLYREREAVLSTQDVYNKNLPERFFHVPINPEVDSKDIEVHNSDSQEIAKIEALSLIVSECDNKLVTSLAPSLLSVLLPVLSPLLLNSNDQLRVIASDLFVLFANKVEWSALCPHLLLLVQMLGCALVCPHFHAQCDAVKLLSRLLAAPPPLPCHLSAHLLPFFTALLISRGLDKGSSLAALAKMEAQAFPISTSRNKSNEPSTSPHNTFPRRVLQYLEQHSAGDVDLKTKAEGIRVSASNMDLKTKAKGLRVSTPELTDGLIAELQQQQDMILFIVNMCEHCLDKECEESTFSLVVEPLSEERNLQCLAAVLFSEQQAMLHYCTPSKDRWGAMFLAVALQHWWGLARMLDTLSRLARHCKKLVPRIQDAWLQEAVRPLLQRFADIIELASVSRRQNDTTFDLRELRLTVESLKFQFHFYDEAPEDLVHYLNGVCETQISELSSAALGTWSHLLVDTLQMIVSTCTRGQDMPYARSAAIRLSRGQSLAEPMVQMFAQEHPRVSIDVKELARNLGSKVLADADATRDRWKALADCLLEGALALYKEQNLPTRVKEALLEALLLIVHRNDLQLLMLRGVLSWCSTLLEELCHLMPLPACVLRSAVLIAARHRALLDPYLPHARDAICYPVRCAYQLVASYHLFCCPLIRLMVKKKVSGTRDTPAQTRVVTRCHHLLRKGMNNTDRSKHLRTVRSLQTTQSWLEK